MSSLLQKIRKGVSETIRKKTKRKATKKSPSEGPEKSQQTSKGSTASSRPTVNLKRSPPAPAPAPKKSQRNASSNTREPEPKSKMSQSRSIDIEESARQEESRNEKESRSDKKEEEKRSEEPKSDTKKEERPAKKVWTGSDAADKFVAKANNIEKLRAEFAFLDSLTFNKTTEAFDANAERNRPGVPKMFDENRVKLDRPGHENVNYINASEITVKDFAHKIIICQLPRMENESFIEDFWLMMYQKEMVLLYLLLADDVLHPAAQPIRLFKPECGEFQYVGKMFINTRRSEPALEPKEYAIEVLPEGNSNSVICQLHHLAAWRERRQPPKTKPLIKMIHHFLSEKQIQTGNVCVMSEFGCGRACSFVAALIAVDQLNKGIEPNIADIMTEIKKQRPGAVESFAQYCGIYAIVLDYISRKRGSKKDDANKELNRFIGELIEVSPPTSPEKRK